MFDDAFSKKKKRKKWLKKLYEGIAVVKKAQITHSGDVRSCDSAPARIFSARKEKEKRKKRILGLDKM